MSERIVTLFAESVERFADRVDAVDDDQWSAPTPCSGWDIRALVNHVCNEQLWAPHLTAGETTDQVGDRYDGDVLGTEPAKMFRVAAERAIDAFRSADLDDPVHLSFGDPPCRTYLGQMLTDAEVHGWDLAESLGHPARIDPEIAEVVLPQVTDDLDALRSADMVGPPAEVGDDAGPGERLLALLGRTP